MSLQSSVRKGDWVKLTSNSGSTIIGQAAHDISLGGFAALNVLIGSDRSTTRGGAIQVLEVTVNVNYWNVEVLMGNMIGREAHDER